MSHGDCAPSGREGLFSRLGDEAKKYMSGNFDFGAEAQQAESRLHRSVGMNFSKVLYGDGAFQPRTNVEQLIRNGLCLGQNTNPSTEQRALDAIGEAAVQELEKRIGEIYNLRDQLAKARYEAERNYKYFEAELAREKASTLTEREAKMSYWNQRDHCRAQLNSIMDIMLEPESDRIDFDALPLALAHVLVTVAGLKSGVGVRAMAYIEQQGQPTADERQSVYKENAMRNDQPLSDQN